MGSGDGAGTGKGAGKGGCGPDQCTCSEGCIHCSRVTLIVFNSLFLIIGLAVLGLGIWFVVDRNIMSILQIAGGLTQGSDIIRVIAYVFLATGGAIFIVSLFGLIGASRWSQCMLATYIALIAILIAAQVAVVILGFVSSRSIGQELKNGMNSFIINDYDDNDNLLSNGFRRLQASRECCGVDGYGDWVNLDTKWYRDNGTTSGWNWPKTCCVLENKNDPNSNPRNEAQCRAGNVNEVNTRGCYDQMEYFLRRYAFAIGGAFVGVFVLQVLVLIFASIVHKGVIANEYGMSGVKPMVV